MIFKFRGAYSNYNISHNNGSYGSMSNNINSSWIRNIQHSTSNCYYESKGN